jgi:hypothetical protein
MERRESSCQKLLFFSATQESNPAGSRRSNYESHSTFFAGIGGEDAGEEGQVGAMADAAMGKLNMQETLRIPAHACVLSAMLILMSFTGWIRRSTTP